MKHRPDLSDPDLLPPKLLLPPTDSDEIKRRAARERIARSLDLAVLKPPAGWYEVNLACTLVKENDIASVCVPSCFVKLAASRINRVCSVVGFPHGNSSPQAKISEAFYALEDGACELDVVINYSRFLAGNRSCIVAELEPIVAAAERYGASVKAILETCYYTPEQIADACRLCADLGVDWVKTSTGFGAGGATPEAVQIMLDTVKGHCQVKASGGVSNYAIAKQYLDLGCTRIGSSKFLELLP